MLSYDDSKRLKELGYPQELDLGDWAYIIPVSIVHPTLFDQHWLDKGGWLENDYVKVPTTDGMIEGLVKSRQFEQIYWHPIGDLFEVVGYRNRYSGQPLEDERRKACEEEIDQVLCELWKKAKG